MSISRPRASLLGAVAVAAMTVPALNACGELRWVERICEDDEVAVQYKKAGGGHCRPRKESDPDCPDDEIPREQRPGRELDCIPNDVTKKPYADE